MVVVPHPSTLEVRQLELTACRLIKQVCKRHIIAAELLLHQLLSSDVGRLPKPTLWAHGRGEDERRVEWREHGHGGGSRRGKLRAGWCSLSSSVEPEEGYPRFDRRRVEHLLGKGWCDQDAAHLVCGYTARLHVPHVGRELGVVPTPRLDDLQLDRDVLARLTLGEEINPIARAVAQAYLLPDEVDGPVEAKVDGLPIGPQELLQVPLFPSIGNGEKPPRWV